MAKKKNVLSPLFLGLVFSFVLLSQVTRAVWVACGIAALAGLAIYWFSRSRKPAVTQRAATPDIPLPPGGALSARLVPAQPSRRPVTASTHWVMEEDSPVPVASTARRQELAEFTIPVAPSHLAAGVPQPQPPSPSPRPASQWTGPTRWVPPGEVISVAGVSIPGGMVYVGSFLTAASGGPDPALLDPTKPVNLAGKYVERSMAYWPSYSDIDPRSRGAYLNWLADGRKDPAADVGYVFLFFYGLERRFITDNMTNPGAETEQLQIADELRRLLSIYGKEYSFRRYAEALLNWISMPKLAGRLYEQPVPKLERGWELPPYLRLALGLAASARAPIPAHLACAWAMLEPTCPLRTPATRCPELFAKAFAEKYRDAFGDGLVLQKNRTKVKFEYQAASSGFRGAKLRLNYGDIPDVTALTAPVKKIAAVSEDAMKVLDAYSRFLSKNPDSALALEALVLLPVGLWPDEAQQKILAVKVNCVSEPVVMLFKELLATLGATSTLTKDKVLGLATALESLSVSIEPDVLAGAKLSKPDDSVVLFASLPGEVAARGTPAYQAAMLTLQVASTVAAADGDFGTAEHAHLRTQVLSWGHLSQAQINRLLAHLKLLVAEPASLPTLKKKIAPLDPSAKEAIASFMTAVAQCDGTVSPEELKTLEKVYKALGVEPKQVFSDVHAAAAGQVASRQGSTLSKSAPQLDLARIAALQKDTERVSALLAGIFKDEAPPVVFPAVAVPEETDNDVQPDGASVLLGLDEPHTAFARMLMSRPSWTRAELLDVAADLDLLLDGALESINEASFDAHDAPLTEGDDPVEVNAEILEKIAA